MHTSIRKTDKTSKTTAAVFSILPDKLFTFEALLFPK